MRVEDVRRVTRAVLIGTGLVAVAGCGSPPAPTVTPARSASPSASASSASPCASVTTTTPIDDVPAACAALWFPYQVTEVPPPNILQLEHVPPAPPVVNMTDGAVSDATAQLWANASNRDSGWYKWAEANDQPEFLPHLVGSALINPQDESALSNGAAIDQPDCNLYPTSEVLFKVTPDGRAYFTRKHLPADDTYVFVVAYSNGPCIETIQYPGGRTTHVEVFSRSITAFSPGKLETDPVLGDLWFGDAGGNCQDPEGPPADWCGR